MAVHVARGGEKSSKFRYSPSERAMAAPGAAPAPGSGGGRADRDVPSAAAAAPHHCMHGIWRCTTCNAPRWPRAWRVARPPALLPHAGSGAPAWDRRACGCGAAGVRFWAGACLFAGFALTAGALIPLGVTTEVLPRALDCFSESTSTSASTWQINPALRWRHWPWIIAPAIACATALASSAYSAHAHRPRGTPTRSPRVAAAAAVWLSVAGCASTMAFAAAYASGGGCGLGHTTDGIGCGLDRVDGVMTAAAAADAAAAAAAVEACTCRHELARACMRVGASASGPVILYALALISALGAYLAETAEARQSAGRGSPSANSSGNSPNPARGGSGLRAEVLGAVTGPLDDDENISVI